MKSIFFLVAICISTSTFAGRIRDIDFSIDTSNFGRTNTFEITVFLIKKSGKRITMAPNQFSLYWGKLQVTGQHIQSFKHGIITFDQNAINSENNKIVLDISYNDRQHTMQSNIVFPYVKSIKIRNNTIPVNHLVSIDYDLIFSNGKKTSHDNSLLNESNLISTSSSEVTISNSQFMVQLNEPAQFDSLKVGFKSKLSDIILDEKMVKIEYPTTCAIYATGTDGANGQNGKDGAKYSENGTSASSGQNGGNGKDIRIFAKTMTVNNKKYIILQSFSSNGTHQTEVIWYDGRPIIVSANGGQGGNGGNGGNGMKGLIDKTKQINFPNGGNGGNGGNAGSGGNAGTIYFVFNSSSEDLKSYFSTTTQGGQPGIYGNGGNGAKGDYSDLLLGGKILTTRDGKQGNYGMKGSFGKNGSSLSPQIVSDAEWNAQYLKNLNEGFVK